MADLKFNIFVDNDKLKRGLNGAKKELSSFEQSAKKVSSGFKKALGGLGLAVGISALTGALKQFSQAAVEDSKSAALLATTLRNVTGATDESIAAVEERIKGLQTEVAIADDQLRPAYAQLVSVLGNTEHSYQALTLATDVAAGKGKDLGTVSAALSKAYAGNRTALDKLVPGLSKTEDFVSQLETRFSGMAKVAANADPYKRMEIIFGEIQEQLGQYLIPYLQKFAEYLASTEGQKQIEVLVETFANLVSMVANSISFIAENAEMFRNLALAIGLTVTAWVGLNVAVEFFRLRALGASVAQSILNIAMGAFNPAAAAIGVTSLALAMAAYGASTETAADETERLAGAQEGLQSIDFSRDTAPLNPKPGEVYTWFNYSDRNNPNLAVWWQQTWTGTTWTKPVRMTYTPNAKTTSKKTGDDPVKKALERMKKAAEQIKGYGQSFRDSVDLALGLNESGTRFSADRFIRQLQRAAEAAKKLPALLEQIRAGKKTGSTALANQIASLDPIQGAAIAEGILSSGKLGEILSLRNSLQLSGQKTALAGAGNAVYSININKANISGAEIVAAIKQFERSTGRQVLING